jgi:hypothetical protein
MVTDFFDGGDKEDRTPDLCVANAALSQLSYTPKLRKLIKVKLKNREQVLLTKTDYSALPAELYPQI